MAIRENLRIKNLGAKLRGGLPHFIEGFADGIRSLIETMAFVFLIYGLVYGTITSGDAQLASTTWFIVVLLVLVYRLAGLILTWREDHVPTFTDQS